MSSGNSILCTATATTACFILAVSTSFRENTEQEKEFSEPQSAGLDRGTTVMSSHDGTGAGDYENGFVPLDGTYEMQQQPSHQDDQHLCAGGTTFYGYHAVSIANLPYSPGNVLMAALALYVISCALAILIAFYKFFSVWNWISQAQRFESYIKRIKRRRIRDGNLQTHVHVDTMNATHCPICLADFFEQELVTACDDNGCGTWFHKECLFEWLERSEACPCCRKNMLSPPKLGWINGILSLLGFKPSNDQYN